MQAATTAAQRVPMVGARRHEQPAPADRLTDGHPFALGWPGLRHFSWTAPVGLAVVGAVLGALSVRRGLSMGRAAIGGALGAAIGGAAMLGIRALTQPRLPTDAQMLHASDSVVQLTSYRRGGLELGFGSGWVAAPDVIVTNEHVVGDRETLDVFTGDGRRLRGHVISSDPATDVALLRVDGLGLEPLVLDPDPAAGSERYGILGYPSGGPFTWDAVAATWGFTPVRVSAQDVASGASFLDQAFEGPVAGGNSGGPVVDDDGHVVATVHMRGGSNTIYGIRNDVVRAALELAHIEPGPREP